MGNSYTTRPRVEEPVTYTTGAIDTDFTIHDSAQLVSVHVNATSPASEDMVVRMKNAAGVVVRSYTFDPAAEDTPDEITKVFELWRWAEDGGTLNVTYANTGNTVASIIASWEYDAR